MQMGLSEPQRAGASAAGRSARELPVYLYRVSVFQDRTGQLAQMGAVRRADRDADRADHSAGHIVEAAGLEMDEEYLYYPQYYFRRGHRPDLPAAV